MLKKIAICFVLGLAGCVSYDSYYKLPEDYQSARQAETRRFEAKNEEEILSASAAVLQDLGFTIEESETNLGLITATKDRKTANTAEKITITLLSLASNSNEKPVYDVRQRIYVTLVSTKSKTNPGYNVRIKFGRMIWNNLNESRVEELESNKIYSEFFDKLSQSLFLIANDL